MLSEILNGFLLSFFVLSVFTVLYELVMLVLRPSKGEKYTVVVYIDSYNSQVSESLYAHLLRLDLRGEAGNACVVAVDVGMNETEKRHCREFCTETKNIILCEPSELCDLIERLQKGNKDGLSANGRKY